MTVREESFFLKMFINGCMTEKKNFPNLDAMFFFLEEARPFIKSKIDSANRHASMSVPQTPSGLSNESSASTIVNYLLNLIEEAFYISEV